MAVIFTIVIIFGALAGTPLFVIVGGASMFIFHFISQVDISSSIIESVRLANAPGIMAIPLFVLAGYILVDSKSSHRLVNLSNASIGWLPGGATIVTVVACSIFTAMTGASGITIVAIAALMYPFLLEEGYSEKFSMGLVSTTGDIGLLFAPSLPIILYGMVAQVDITQLFIAGVIPGVFFGLVVCAYGMIYAIAKKIPTITFSFTNLKKAVWDAKWEIPLPFIVVGGIYGGLVTVSEAATITAVYVLITECLIYREIKLKRLMAIFWESAIMTGAILCVLAGAMGLTNAFVDLHMAERIMTMLTATFHSKWTFLLGLNFFLLIVGCFLEIFSAIIVVAPLIIPTALAYGIHPVHLGIIFLSNMEVSYMCPPVGLNLLLANLRFGVPMMKLYRYVIPFLIRMIISLLIITYFPQMSLWLIDVFGMNRELIQM
ncbi:MAG: C4-dicarboxylate ABC transporter [Smithella sp. SDB]|nr:MAG: C4-dicarboxylate ABC transporter [Smithella sp. SDB]